MEYEGQTLESYIRSSSRQKPLETENMSGGAHVDGVEDECVGMTLERYMWTGTTPKASSLFNVDTSTVLFPLKKVISFCTFCECMSCFHLEPILMQNRSKKDGTASKRNRTPRSASRRNRTTASDKKQRQKAEAKVGKSDISMAVDEVELDGNAQNILDDGTFERYATV